MGLGEGPQLSGHVHALQSEGPVSNLQQKRKCRVFGRMRKVSFLRTVILLSCCGNGHENSKLCPGRTGNRGGSGKGRLLTNSLESLDEKGNFLWL